MESGHGQKRRHCGQTVVNDTETEYSHHASPMKHAHPSLIGLDCAPFSRALESSLICSFLVDHMIRKRVSEEFLQHRQFYLCSDPYYGGRPCHDGYVPQRKLVFANKVNQNVYTGEKIADQFNNPVIIMLIDTFSRDICMDVASHIEVKLMVLDGDFDQDDCSSEGFSTKALKPRSGKPLLVGALKTVLKEGTCKLEDLTFTDNSSWVRSGMFRLGACVSWKHHDTIGEALSNPFCVKERHVIVEKKREQEQRTLDDEVWQLNKIPKYGIYHFRLKAEWINSVRDFLRMMFTSSTQLKEQILQMPNRDWDEVVRDAMKCFMGNEFYLFEREETVIKFNPIGVILEVSIDGESFLYEDLSSQNRALVDQMASEAYQQWSHLKKL